MLLAALVAVPRGLGAECLPAHDALPLLFIVPALGDGPLEVHVLVPRRAAVRRLPGLLDVRGRRCSAPLGGRGSRRRGCAGGVSIELRLVRLVSRVALAQEEREGLYAITLLVYCGLERCTSSTHTDGVVILTTRVLPRLLIVLLHEPTLLISILHFHHSASD
jgi:hypothetical protein